MRILITSPSLNESENLSGISSLVKNIITHKTGNNIFTHLRLGKTNQQKKTNLKWYINQVLLIPVVFFKVLRNRVDLVHLNTGLEKASIIRDYVVFIISKIILGRKVLFHIHGGYYLMQPPNVTSVFFKLTKSIIDKADLVVVLSELEKKQIDNTYGCKTYVLINAIDIPQKNNDISRSFHAKPLTFTFLGRIVTSKGIVVILNCLKKLQDHYNDFHFDVYGAGSETAFFINELKAIEGLSYTYHGIASGTEKWVALKKSHVFLLPSIHSEGLPIAILEAMAVGCICLVSDDASISTVIIDNETGYLVKRGDEEALLNKLIYILNNRRGLDLISANASKFVREHHTFGTYMQNLEAYYNLC